jgi:NAD(P)-dependent dehydrogenase (short-subunit alcohol dehydrogenase family)
MTVRTIVVTGASSGIGLACAVGLARAGFRVFAGVRQEKDHQSLSRMGLDLLTPIFLDVTDASAIAAAVRQVKGTTAELGLHMLLNNAGIVVPGSLEFLPIDDIRQQFEVNVFGLVAVTQAFLPLVRIGHGRIVNMGSTGGKIAMPFIGPYTASKFAVEAFTDSLRIELRPWKIPVSIVEASFIATPLWDKTNATADDILKRFPEQAHQLYGSAFSRVKKTYLKVGRYATCVASVTNLVVRIASVKKPKARYVVGRGARLQTRVFAHLPQRMRDFLIGTLIAVPHKD